MKKFYLKNGEEVHFGDVISKTNECSHPIFGESVSVSYIKVTKRNISDLIKAGVIKVEGSSDNTVSSNKSEKGKSEVPMELEYYVQKVIKRLQPEGDTCKILGDISLVYTASLFSMILKEIAIELDKKYNDHIKSSPEIYVISLMDGKISKVNKAHIKSYRNFAAFRTLEDARTACKITRSMLKAMFKNGK